jgi:hypothetical protein
MKKPATKESGRAENWGDRVVKDARPVSFLLDGKPFAELLQDWQQSSEACTGEDGHAITTERFRDPATGLECRFERTVYPDSPAAEWVIYFRNDGSADTPILSEVQALDISLDVPQGGEPCLFYSKGTPVKIDDFALQEKALPAGETAELASYGSRSVLPFFNLDLGGRGVIGAIGWTACWKLTAERAVEDLDSGTVTHATGQALQETGLAVAIDNKPGAVVILYRKYTEEEGLT